MRLDRGRAPFPAFPSLIVLQSSRATATRLKRVRTPSRARASMCAGVPGVPGITPARVPHTHIPPHCSPHSQCVRALTGSVQHTGRSCRTRRPFKAAAARPCSPSSFWLLPRSCWLRPFPRFNPFPPLIRRPNNPPSHTHRQAGRQLLQHPTLPSWLSSAWSSSSQPWLLSTAQGTCPGLAITAKSSRHKLVSGAPVKSFSQSRTRAPRPWTAWACA